MVNWIIETSLKDVCSTGLATKQYMMQQVLMVLQFLVYWGTVIGFGIMLGQMILLPFKVNCVWFIELQDEDKPIWFPAKSGM